jgi:hypothetical protein
MGRPRFGRVGFPAKQIGHARAHPKAPICFIQPVSAAAGGCAVAQLPLKLESLNHQESGWKRAKRRELQRATVRNIAGRAIKTIHVPCKVTITRYAPRDLDDDNLIGSAKSVRDEIAALLGVDDRDPRIEWKYWQQPWFGRYELYGVGINIEETNG